MEIQLLGDEQFQMREFQCPVCMKYFSRKFTLDVHLLIHKGVKPHPCPFCGKCFRQKGTLMRHKALHSTSNLFHCKLCDRGFRQKNVFLYHLKHRHNVTTETLDRRKYRTELKDHKSIMDTLPSFVQADSTAIASSEKQLDAMLFQALGNNTGDLESSVKVREKADNIILEKREHLSLEPENDLSNSDKDSTELVHQKKSFCYVCGLCSKNFFDYSSFQHHITKDHNNNEMLYDTKPIEISQVTSESNLLGCPSKQNNNNLKYCEIICNSNTLNENLKSNNPNEDVNLCVMCQQSFETKEDFETHILIHVKNMQSAATSVLSNSSILSKKDSPEENVFHFVSSTSNNENKHVEEVLQICESSNHPQVGLLLPKLKGNPSSCIMPSEKSKIKKPEKLLNSNSNIKKFDKNSRQFCKVLKGNSPDKSLKRCNGYKCELCSKFFRNKSSLEYHKQLHLSFKGFNCGLCKRYFNSKSLLLSHTRSSHMKNFRCSSCSRIFQYRSLYLQHIKLCTDNSFDFKNLKDLNLPITSINQILKSDTDGIVGIIPLSQSEGSNEATKFCIPIISLAAVKKHPNLSLFDSFVKMSDLLK